jgi:hypothetical protein
MAYSKGFHVRKFAAGVVFGCSDCTKDVQQTTHRLEGLAYKVSEGVFILPPKGGKRLFFPDRKSHYPSSFPAPPFINQPCDTKTDVSDWGLLQESE